MVRLKILEDFRYKRLMEPASVLETEAEFNQMVTDESTSKLLPWPLGKAHLSEGAVWSYCRELWSYFLPCFLSSKTSLTPCDMPHHTSQCLSSGWPSFLPLLFLLCFLFETGFLWPRLALTFPSLPLWCHHNQLTWFWGCNPSHHTHQASTWPTEL